MWLGSEWLGCWVCNQQVTGLTRQLHHWAAILGKSFTHVLSTSEVKLYSTIEV